MNKNRTKVKLKKMTAISAGKVTGIISSSMTQNYDLFLKINAIFIGFEELIHTIWILFFSGG